MKNKVTSNLNNKESTTNKSKKNKRFVLKKYKPILYVTVASSFLSLGACITTGVMSRYSTDAKTELNVLIDLRNQTKDIIIDTHKQYEDYWLNIFGSVSINGYDNKTILYKSELLSNSFMFWLFSVSDDTKDIKITYDKLIHSCNLDSLVDSRNKLIEFDQWIKYNNQEVVLINDILGKYDELSFINVSFSDYYVLWVILTVVFVIISIACGSYSASIAYRWNKNKAKDNIEEANDSLEVKEDSKLSSKTTNKSNNKASSKLNSKSSTKSSKTRKSKN